MRAEQKVWTIIADPRVDGLQVMKANVRGDSRTTMLTHCLLSLHIVDEQVDDLVRRERCDHLQIDFFDLRHAVGPRFRILGPTQPSSMMWMPLGRHVEAECGGSVHGCFSHRVQSGEL